MFILNDAPAGPDWITLRAATEGVKALRLKVRAGETAALIAGRQARRRAADDGLEGADLDLAFVVGVARWATTDWSGVGDSHGAPLAFAPDLLERLLRQSPAAYLAFDGAYVVPLLLGGAEKNGSSPSRAGTSARAAKPTAAGARSRSAAKPAPIGKTGSKPSRANGSGTS